ncbi:MAG: BrnT family toxin [Burkholderiaceae bacterium]|jgi:uncharacterized DUF497 family protein
MNLTFDPAKDAANVVKHGVSLALALQLEWDDMLSWIDRRRDYGEVRMSGLAPLGDRLYFVAFVVRPSAQPTERRIISLRKANTREVRRYARNN